MTGRSSRRELIAVGLGELKTSGAKDSSLVAFGLGSCVAIVAHDPARKIGGMAHVMLPEGPADEEPLAKYGDAAIAMLLEELGRQGAQRDNLAIKIAGGASMLPESATTDRLNIGDRNVVAIKRLLREHGLSVAGQDTGGRQSRTVELNVTTGRVTVHRLGGQSLDL
ncbi:MAG: chemotaxis protein CheD [Chloroflexota bacterium]